MGSDSQGLRSTGNVTFGFDAWASYLTVVLPASPIQKRNVPEPERTQIRMQLSRLRSMCKHFACDPLRVRASFDTEPELFFKMRGVDQSELVSEAMGTQLTAADPLGLDQQSDLAGEDLAEIFGINLATNQAIPDANDHAKKTSVVQKRAQAKDIKRKVKAKAKSKTKSTPTEIDKDKSSGKSRTNKKTT